MTEVWTNAEVALLQVWVQQGKRSNEIVKLLAEHGIDRTQKAITRKLARETAKDPYAWHAMVNESKFPRFTGWERVQGDALCLFDAQAPFHDAPFINAMMGLAIDWGVKNLILGGDMIDFATFSPYGGSPNVLAEDEIIATEQMMDAFAANFERVVWVSGNHEQRLTKRFDGLVSHHRAFKLFSIAENVTISDYRYCELESGGESFYVEHPGNFSSTPTQVAVKLCSIHLKHVIAGHGHLWGRRLDASGKFYAVDSGICADPLRLEYANKTHKTYPKQVQGAVIVRSGKPWLFLPSDMDDFKRLRWVA